MFKKLRKYIGESDETLGTLDVEDVPWLCWRRKRSLFFSSEEGSFAFLICDYVWMLFVYQCKPRVPSSKHILTAQIPHLPWL